MLQPRFLDRIRNRFPRNMDTRAEFVATIKAEDCPSVTLTPSANRKNSRKNFALGVVADFQFVLKFSAKTSRGRELVYQEPLFDWYGSESAEADERDRLQATTRVFLLGERKMRELQKELPPPEVYVSLIGPNGEVMDAELIAMLHSSANQLGVFADSPNEAKSFAFVVALLIDLV